MAGTPLLGERERVMTEGSKRAALVSGRNILQ